MFQTHYLPTSILLPRKITQWDERLVDCLLWVSAVFMYSLPYFSIQPQTTHRHRDAWCRAQPGLIRLGRSLFLVSCLPITKVASCSWEAKGPGRLNVGRLPLYIEQSMMQTFRNYAILASSSTVPQGERSGRMVGEILLRQFPWNLTRTCALTVSLW